MMPRSTYLAKRAFLVSMSSVDFGRELRTLEAQRKKGQRPGEHVRV